MTNGVDPGWNQDLPKPKSKYHKAITKVPVGKDDPETFVIDTYDINKAFGVTCTATAHAIKKLLMPGERHAKTKLQDLNEAKKSIERAIELETEQYEVKES